MKALVAVLVIVVGADLSLGQNCQGITVPGLRPLTELQGGSYQGFQGGLYPNGTNEVPAQHSALANLRASGIVPRDAAGVPDPNGRVVLLSLGMSNTSQEFTRFLSLVAADTAINPRLTVVNGAQGGQTAAIISNPLANFWTVVDQRLAQRGVTPAQVQAIWLKEANAQPTAAFPAHMLTLKGQLKTITQIIQQRYPNAALCFMSSRTYGGYATTALNPEPFAYESGFAVKGLIEDQIGGAAGLNADPAAGPIEVPCLLWGPYLWANGVLPRQDGLSWVCTDFEADGTHPGPTGEEKVARLLKEHLTEDPASAPWFQGTPIGVPVALLLQFGQGCAGVSGVPAVFTNGLPRLSTSDFRIGLQAAASTAAATLVLSLRSDQVPLGNGCFAWIDLAPPFLLAPTPALPLTILTSAQGNGFISFSIPNDMALAGVHIFAEWVVVDPSGLIPGGASSTRALMIRIGT